MDICAWVSLSWENFWNSQKVLAARMQGFLFRLCMCVYSTQRALLRVDIHHICRSHYSFNGGSAFFVVSPLHFNSEFLLLLLPADEWIINKRVSRVGIIHDAGGGTVHALLAVLLLYDNQPKGKRGDNGRKRNTKNMYTRRERAAM